MDESHKHHVIQKSMMGHLKIHLSWIDRTLDKAESLTQNIPVLPQGRQWGREGVRAASFENQTKEERKEE